MIVRLFPKRANRAFRIQGRFPRRKGFGAADLFFSRAANLSGRDRRLKGWAPPLVVAVSLERTGMDQEAFTRLMSELRPRLHRYCARMTGSAVDGEDVVQDAMIKALDALATVGPIDNPEGWLFRIAHNTALDLQRRHARQPLMQPAEELDTIPSDDPLEDGEETAAVSLRTFLSLP